MLSLGQVQVRFRLGQAKLAWLGQVRQVTLGKLGQLGQVKLGRLARFGRLGQVRLNGF